MALGGQHFIRRINNQLTDVIHNGSSGIREEACQVGHVWGCHPIPWGIELKDKKIEKI
jgi:hypothetical protein